MCPSDLECFSTNSNPSAHRDFHAKSCFQHAENRRLPYGSASRRRTFSTSVGLSPRRLAASLSRCKFPESASTASVHRPKAPRKGFVCKKTLVFFDTFLRRFAKQTEFFFCFCPTALVFSILAPRRLASPCGLKRRGVIPSPLALMRLPIFPLRETNPTAQIYRGSPFPFGGSSRRLPLQICADGVLPSYVRVFAVMCVRMCAFSPHCVRLPVVIASATGARRRVLRHSRAADA